MTIGMLSLPKMRYVRRTVRTLLDFISENNLEIANRNPITVRLFSVSLGGIVGLLYGASLITILELVFKGYRRLCRR